MSLIAARKKRTTLYLSVAGLMVMVAAVSAISARDADGVSVRIGMIMVTVGAALWLPWRQLIPAVLLAWLLPNLGRSLVDETFTLPNVNMALELVGLAGIAFFTTTAREGLKNLEQENLLLGSGSSDLAGLNPETGIFDESQLLPTLEGELARSRRFGRTFSLVLVGIDEMRQKFDYRDDVAHRLSRDATANLLRQTRHNVDRVFHYRSDGFAIILPETTDKDIPGLVKRLRRLARGMKPAEGEPGGPMPVHFGATFFPDCATSVDDLLRRAEVALRISASSTTRYQLDSAEAPEMPPAETLRRENVEVEAVLPVAEMQPPPVVTNPVAAAIVDEAYAERAREAVTEVVQPVVETRGDEGIAVPIVASEEPIEAAPAPEPIMETPLEPVAFAPVAPVDADLLPERFYEPVVGSVALPEPAARVAVEPPVPAPEEPVEVAAELVAPRIVESAPVALAQPIQVATEVSDDFEALLKQMDETLKMIKSVRSSAA
jgi:GGDEF domain-containing protein